MNSVNYDPTTQNLSYQSIQQLTFGTAPKATTGENLFDIQNGRPRLDSIYCENELPPIPVKDVFDARWSIAGTNGTLRNIFPEDSVNTIYRAVHQAGGVTGGASSAFPIGIMWRKSDIPAQSADPRNPKNMLWILKDDQTQGGIFYTNMKTAAMRPVQDVDLITIGSSTSDTVLLINNRNTITGFTISMVAVDGVEDNASIINGLNIAKIAPQPMSDEARVEFNISEPRVLKVEIFDALGSLVKSFSYDATTVGVNSINLDGKDNAGIPMTTGSYTVRLSSGSFNAVAPFVIVR
jgi:hypothetical protein